MKRGQHFDKAAYQKYDTCGTYGTCGMRLCNNIADLFASHIPIGTYIICRFIAKDAAAASLQ